MNVEAIKTRLKRYSKRYNKVHQYTIIRYFQERLLYRLSISRYRDNFFLKGGALIYVFKTESSRYTKDIDFSLTKLDAEYGNMINVFKKIGQIKVEDGVKFDTDKITVEPTQKEGKYGGIRIKMMGKLGNIKQQLQIDIGIGDYIIPGSQEIEYPTLIKEMAKPVLKAYSIESLIAEKFEAMISLGEFNSRYKDFYDLYNFVDQCNLVTLEKAVKNTFERRNTLITKEHPVFQESFYEEEKRNKQWMIFLSKNQLGSLSFKDVYKKLQKFLFPIYQRL